MLSSFAGKDLNVDDLKLIEDHFQDDLDFRRLPAQLQVLSNLRLESSVKTFKQVVDELHKMGGQAKLIPDVITLTKLCLVLPASTAFAERFSSSLRRIKSYLRSTMSQERLNHLLILHTYTSRLDKLALITLQRQFIACNDIRRKTFHMP